MSDYDELQRTQQNTQEMLDDIGVFYGLALAIAGAGVVGLVIWLAHLFT